MIMIPYQMPSYHAHCNQTDTRHGRSSSENAHQQIQKPISWSWLQWKEKEREDGYQSYHATCTGFSSQGGAKLRAFLCYCIAEDTQLGPLMTPKPSLL